MTENKIEVNGMRMWKPTVRSSLFETLEKADRELLHVLLVVAPPPWPSAPVTWWQSVPCIVQTVCVRL